MRTPETIQSKVEHLSPGAFNKNKVPAWPPDAFCLCAAILQTSGSYSRVIDDASLNSRHESSEQRSKRLGKVGLEWTKSFDSGKPPELVKELWSVIFEKRRTLLSELASDEVSDLRNALLDMLAIADEACVEIGIYKIDSRLRDRGGLGTFRFQAESLFVSSMSGIDGATLCKDIHPSRARVLPKMHTPQSGLTIRSMSHHLGYCPGSDMRPNWYSLASTQSSHSFNLLIVPWPKVVDPSQFALSKQRGVSDEVGAGGYGLFTFHLKSGPTTEFVRSLLHEATLRVGHIDGIVFPELAMSETEFNKIAE
ncbi:MAG TPA: hypothetical protein VGN16_22190 [Acidobacteriaceae bacterium]